MAGSWPDIAVLAGAARLSRRMRCLRESRVCASPAKARGSLARTAVAVRRPRLCRAQGRSSSDSPSTLYRCIPQSLKATARESGRSGISVPLVQRSPCRPMPRPAPGALPIPWIDRPPPLMKSGSPSSNCGRRAIHPRLYGVRALDSMHSFLAGFVSSHSGFQRWSGRRFLLSQPSIPST
jgi:hypothetical protein